jgi:signal transduction histidine kinase
MSFNNGLTNTGNRIKAIHGDLIFERKAGEGLKIQLRFPKV